MKIKPTENIVLILGVKDGRWLSNSLVWDREQQEERNTVEELEKDIEFLRDTIKYKDKDFEEEDMIIVLYWNHNLRTLRMDAYEEKDGWTAESIIKLIEEQNKEQQNK